MVRVHSGLPFLGSATSHIYSLEQKSLSAADTTVHKVELLQLADEKYPIRAERLEDVIQAAAGKPVDHIALLTPRQVETLATRRRTVT